MAVEILIDFAPVKLDDSFVHRARNFGEDLYRLSREDRSIEISIDEVDRATTQLRLKVAPNRQRLRILRQIETLLAQHFLADVAQVTERDGSG